MNLASPFLLLVAAGALASPARAARAGPRPGLRAGPAPGDDPAALRALRAAGPVSEETGELVTEGPATEEPAVVAAPSKKGRRGPLDRLGGFLASFLGRGPDSEPEHEGPDFEPFPLPLSGSSVTWTESYQNSSSKISTNETSGSITRYEGHGEYNEEDIVQGVSTVKRNSEESKTEYRSSEGFEFEGEDIRLPILEEPDEIIDILENTPEALLEVALTLGARVSEVYASEEEETEKGNSHETTKEWSQRTGDEVSKNFHANRESDGSNKEDRNHAEFTLELDFIPSPESAEHVSHYTSPDSPDEPGIDASYKYSSEHITDDEVAKETIDKENVHHVHDDHEHLVFKDEHTHREYNKTTIEKHDSNAFRIDSTDPETGDTTGGKGLSSANIETDDAFKYSKVEIEAEEHVQSHLVDGVGTDDKVATHDYREYDESKSVKVTVEIDPDSIPDSPVPVPSPTTAPFASPTSPGPIASPTSPAPVAGPTSPGPIASPAPNF